MSDQPGAIRIQGRAVGPGEPVYVIARIGMNHNGRTADARRLIKQADAAGASAVSLPVYRTDSVVSEQADLAPGRQSSIGDLARNQRNMLGRFELAPEAIEDLRSLATERGLDFLPAPRDLESLSHLRTLDPAALLIEAGDLTYHTLVARCRDAPVPLLLSTGMADLEELDRVVQRLQEESFPAGLLLLYQVCCYPPELNDLDLNTIPLYSSRYGCPAGFLDHTLSHQAAESAVSLGACTLGKYLTTNQNAQGPHHSISLEPEPFHTFIQRIRRLETALGSGEKQLSEPEKQNRPFLRRSLAVTASLDEGESLLKEHLTALRPAEGIPADQLEEVVGSRLTTEKHAGELLYERDITSRT